MRNVDMDTLNPVFAGRLTLKGEDADSRLYIASAENYEFSEPILVAGSLKGLEAATKYYLSEIRRYFPLVEKQIPWEIYTVVGSRDLFYDEVVGPDKLRAYRFNFNAFRFSVWYLSTIPGLSSPKDEHVGLGSDQGSVLSPSVFLFEEYDHAKPGTKNYLSDFRKRMLKYALSLGEDWLFYSEED